MPKDYYVYVLCCADGSYYVGYAQDLERRLKAAFRRKSCAFTTARRLPVHVAVFRKT